MKKILSFVLSLLILISLVGCENGEEPAGGSDSEITGSILYFFENGEDLVLDVFSTADTEKKSIELSRSESYILKLRPSFRGSKAAVYVGDVARFDFPSGACEIKCISDADEEPLYELEINSAADFDLKVSVGEYVQTVRIAVIGGDVGAVTELSDFLGIAKSLEASDIQKIEHSSYAGSISPIHRAPVEHRSGLLPSDIEAVLLWLRALDGTITPSDAMTPEGGGSVSLKIHTSHGVLEVWQDAEEYLLICGNRFSQSGAMPMIEGEKISYTFESYYDSASVYFEGIQIGKTEFSFEGVVCESSDAEFSSRLLWLDTCIGQVNVFGSKHFERNGKTYRIIDGTDFSALINKVFAPFDESLSVDFLAEYGSHSKGYGDDNHLYPSIHVFKKQDSFASYAEKEGLLAVLERVGSLEGKVLVAIEFLTGSSAESFIVSDVGRDGGTLTVRLAEPKDVGTDGMTAEWVHYCFVIVDEDTFSGDADNVRVIYEPSAVESI